MPPATGTTYCAFVDPSGGRVDAFACAIGHRDGDSAVIDVLRAWPAPFNPAGATAECADLLRDYRVRRVTGDRFAGEWPREAFRAHGIEYEVAQHNRSELYLALLPSVNAACIELPDDPKLLAELRLLERRRGTSGRDRVDHPVGRHDDRANAIAGLAQLVLARKRRATWADLYGEAGVFTQAMLDDAMPEDVFEAPRK